VIAEHFARYSSSCPIYFSKAEEIAESREDLRQRVLVGSEGLPLFARVKASNVREGTPDLFGENDSITTLLHGSHKKAPSMKALILSANPKQTSELRLGQEARDLRDQLHLVRHARAKITVENCWAVRISDIQREILNNRPDILHFSGHGDKGLLCFEDAAGGIAPVSTKAMADLFRLHTSIKCLVLNACHSAEMATAVAPHVDAVIGCDDEIDDDACIAFTFAFYRALAHGYDYARSFAQAQVEVRMSCGDGEADKYIITVP
jgi:hypothetical protein